MEVKSNFKFRVNVSNDYYVKKTDASACLSLAGAKAIKKVKMAFREQDVTVDEFLTYALNGYAFCNLFDFDPDQSYWFETGDGHRYQTTPLYKDGTNKGCMRLVFKSDRFFSGAQTVFVDIDLTRFDSIPEYIDCLTIKPTCVYMSYSDKLEKDRVTSRRFRMVYVFDRIMGKEDLNVISRTITDSIIRDTGEPMKDDCGTRISQYFNGVYDNEESYAFYNIYSRLDFPESLPVIEDVMPDEQSTKKPEVEFDSHLLHDMGSMDYETFMHYNSLKYRYIYKTQKDEWIDGLYQLTDDSYIQLWWVRERITDGHHRRRTLSKFACLRRLMKPDIDPDTLLFNMYVDLHRFIDNSDGIITIETMKRRVKSVVKIKGSGTSGFMIPAEKAGKFEYDVNVSSSGEDGMDTKEVAGYRVTVVCISSEAGELTRSVIIEDDSGEKREKISAADEQTDGNEKESNDRAERPKDRNGTDEGSDPDPETISEKEQGRAKTGDETEYALALAMMMASLVSIFIFSSRKGGRLL